jgi:hypothetical protein
LAELRQVTRLRYRPTDALHIVLTHLDPITPAGSATRVGDRAPACPRGLVLDEYVAHYNGHRPHRARNLHPPDYDDITAAALSDLTTARTRRRKVLGDLINEYQRAA